MRIISNRYHDISLSEPAQPEPYNLCFEWIDRVHNMKSVCASIPRIVQFSWEGLSKVQLPDFFRASQELKWGIVQIYLLTLTGIICHYRKSVPVSNVRKFFILSCLNLPWCIFVLFPCILSLDPRSRTWHHPLRFPSSGSCREQWGRLLASSSPV